MDDEQFENEYENMSLEQINDIDDLADILVNLDDSWLDSTMGEQDPGPYGCSWYGMIQDSAKGFFAIVRQNDQGFNYCEVYDTAQECRKRWSLIYIDALETALDNGDFEYFGCDTQTELEDMIETIKKDVI